MTEILIRQSEGCDDDPFLLWDSRWSPTEGMADWALASANEPGNAGGLAATRALDTAVILALFTDKRIDDTHPLFYLADGDPRGWWGDGVDVRDDLEERALGSHLWLLERAPLTVQGMPVERWAEQFAQDALATLKEQGAVVRIDAQAVANRPSNRLELTVQIYGRDGANVYDRKFDLVWQQAGFI